MYEVNGIMAYNGARNNIEYKYFKVLEKLKVPFTHISKCYGYIETNLGKGLVFDKVCDYNEKVSLSLKHTMKENRLSKDIEDKLLRDLKEYIFENNILFIDYSIDNILCCEYKKGKYRLVIIDGLGAKRLGFKFWLYLKSKLYTKYKVKKQWKKFLKRYLEIRDEK